MDVESEGNNDQIITKEMKHEDLVEYSKIFASEFNNSSMHDRVLVFDYLDEDSGAGINALNPSMGDLKRKKKSSGDAVDRRKTSLEKIKISKKNLPNQANTDSVLSINNNMASRKFPDTACDDENSVGVHEDKNSEREQNDAEKHKVFVHSSWLAVQSPYFRALFYSGMKESFSKEVVMKICRNELQAHLTLLEAMYRLDVLDDKEYDLVAQVLILANNYDVQMVLRKCKYVLQSILVSTPLSLEKCECILHAVKDLTGCADIYDKLEKFLVKEFTPLDKRFAIEKFLELSEEALRLLLSSNNLAVQSENTVFVALMVWLENNKEISPDDSSLLSVVRFELITVDFLYDFVRDHHLAKRLPSFHTFYHKGLAYHAFSQARREKLEYKPVKRLELKDDGPTFSWVIDNDVRQEPEDLADGMYSVSFFCQGYEMQLNLCYSLDSKTYGFYVHILNLEEESFVNIGWRAQSKLFGSYLISVNHIYEKANETGWGEEGIQSDFPLPEIPEAVSHIVDVWIELI